MSRLNDVIAQVIEGEMQGGAVSARACALKVVGMLEDDIVSHLACAELQKRIKQFMSKARKSAEETSASEPSFPFPDIRLAHALDDENRIVKLTHEMGVEEFDRVIAIREAGIKADAIYLNKLKAARRQLAPIWDENPDFTFGEACEVFVQTHEPQHVAAE
jgi:hypothetical protein